jgi:hypothetical protein
VGTDVIQMSVPKGFKTKNTYPSAHFMKKLDPITPVEILLEDF